MLKVRNRINYLNIVLILFSVINILELFLPRMETQQSFARLPIQLANMLILCIMIYFILIKRLHYNKILRSVLLIFLMILIYFFAYIISGNFILADFSPYLKFITWLIAIIFFYESLIVFQLNPIFFQIYVSTFIIAVAKKIFEASIFDSEKLNGGDTASLPLLFIIPTILLIFRKKLRVLFIIVCVLLVFISLRRTSILALLLCLPFIYRYLQSSLSRNQIFAFGVLFIISFIGMWQKFGFAVEYRLLELFSKNQDSASYGSGRGTFYLIVWNSWIDGDLSLFLGNGLTSVKSLFMKKSEIELHHAHNDFLEILYTFGILGIILWYYFLYAFWKLRKVIMSLVPQNLSVFYVLFISFLFIGLSSGSILRISTTAFSMNLSLLMFFCWQNYRSRLEASK